jgi:choline kinase
MDYMKKKNNFIISPRTSAGSHKDALVTCILLAENCGYRMKSYGPLSMIDIKGKTLLKRQIEAIKSCFFNYEIIISVGFESKKISNYIREKFPSDNIRIVENQIYLNSNCCESIRLCLNNTMNNRVLVIPGNLYFKPHHLSSLKYDKNFILSQDSNVDQSFELSVIQNERKHVQTICFGLKNMFWSEIFFLKNQSSVSNFYSIIDNIDYKNKFAFEAINDFSKNNKIEVLNNVKEEIVKIHNIKTLKRVIK